MSTVIYSAKRVDNSLSCFVEGTKTHEEIKKLMKSLFWTGVASAYEDVGKDIALLREVSAGVNHLTELQKSAAVIFARAAAAEAEKILTPIVQAMKEEKLGGPDGSAH